MSDNESMDTPRTSEEVARRAIVLQCTIAAAHGVSREDISEWLRKENLWGHLTPRELHFMTNESHPKEEIFRMTWFVEAQVSLLWAIRKLDRLPPLTAKCDTGPVVGAMPGLFESTVPFIESAGLRDTAELRREEEQLYSIRCDIDQARRLGKPPPNGYDFHVSFFRHYGLLWVVGYCGQEWDEITPDT
jgi:hypothetical protein